MAFRQVKDLLRWVISFHEMLSVHYCSLAGRQENERMKMALNFLADREQKMSQTMERYLIDADPGLRDTWLIDSQDFVHHKLLERIPRCLDCQDVQDILANVLTAHQTLKDMYQLRSELAQIPKEAELFRELTKNQEAEARLQARDIARLESY